MTTILASVGDFTFSGQSSCFTTTVDKPVNAAIWFPVPKGTSTLPSIPSVIVNTAVPGNSAAVDECFDPDNVDYFYLFNQLLPKEEIAPSYDRSIRTKALLRPRNAEVTIQATTRLTLKVLKSSYSVQPVIVDVDVAVRVPAAAYNLVAKVEGEDGVFSYTAYGAQLNRFRFIAPERAVFAWTGYAALLQIPGDKKLGAGTGTYKVNDAAPVLLLSHFDTEFDEQTGNTVGYNWYKTSAPGISTTFKKIGAGGLNLDYAILGFLYTFVNPALFPEPITSFTIEGWVRTDDGFPTPSNYAIPFGIGKEANADDAGYFVEWSSDEIRVKCRRYGSVTTIFRWEIPNWEPPGQSNEFPENIVTAFAHIAFEYNNGLARVYFNGTNVPNELFENAPLEWPVGFTVGAQNALLDLRGSIMLGYYTDDPVVDYPGTTYGFLDEVRIVAGPVYKGASFSPPLVPYDTASPVLSAANFVYLRTIPADPTSYTYSGQAANIKQISAAIACAPASYALTGNIVEFILGTRRITADAGSYTSVFVPSIDRPSVVSWTNAVQSASITNLAWPTHQAGDLAIVFTETSSVDNATNPPRPATPPYGWTPIAGSVATDNYSYTSAYYKFATSSSEPTLVTPGTNDHQVTIMVVIRNVDPVLPFVEWQTQTDLVPNTSVVFPTLTGVIPRTKLLEVFVRGNDSSTAPVVSSRTSASTSWVDTGLVVNRATSNGDGGGIAVYSADTTKQTINLAGSTGSGGTFHTDITTVVALRPKGWTEPPLVVYFAPVAGSYALVGQAAGLDVPLRTLGAADGTYTLVGYSASFEIGFIMDAESATYSLGGQSAGLAKQWGSLVADAGAFVEVGQDAALLDGTADTYIAAVESADGQDLETTVKVAINKFITGCKADGTWSAIKAACILAGARTLAGALVPLAGTAPTNNNFVSGDYSRTTGLVGDGSTKYLDSNRANNADPQNNSHMGVYVSTIPTVGALLIGAEGFSSTGTTALYSGGGRYKSSSSDSYSVGSIAQTYYGASRASSTQYTVQATSSQTITRTSQTPESSNILLYRRGSTSSPSYSNARLAFYSIGESLDLALLDSRVTTLMSDIAAALP